jgi:hypothetical protein
MSRFDKFLCVIYAITAILALIATWVNNLAFLATPESQSVMGWYNSLYANAAAASFMNDLFFLTFAVCVFIIIEGRKYKIRFFWAYILFSGITAISFTFPLFLIARQIAIARQRKSNPEEAETNM